MRLNLPTTSFPQRLSPQAQRETEDKLREIVAEYESPVSTDKDTSRGQVFHPTFVIHDGPPFANGPLHIGHALNKMLKDTILRHQRERGKRPVLRPGWDCHGLPIEQKARAAEASKRMPKGGRPLTLLSPPPPTFSPLDNTTLSPLVIRATCRKFAQEAIQQQRTLMQQWGLLADWQRPPVTTMDESYETRQLEVLARCIERGLLHHDRRPVYWSPSSRYAHVATTSSLLQ